MAAPKDPDIIPAEQVAELLGVSVHSVYEGAARGEIPHRRVGRRLLFSRCRVQAWMHGDDPSVVGSEAWKPSPLTGKDG